VAFDLLWLNGSDLRSFPLTERRRRALSSADAVSGSGSRPPAAAEEMRLGALRCCLSTRF